MVQSECETRPFSARPAWPTAESGSLFNLGVTGGERKESSRHGLHTITSLIYHVLAVKEVAEAHQAFTPLRDHRCVGVAILPMSCPNMTSERIEMHKP